MKRPRRRPARRQFLRLCAVCLAALGALASGCASRLKSRDEESAGAALGCPPGGDERAFDYVIVGSGAGGGPLAANLALAGFNVMLLEAGGDEASLDYSVPAFHARASEDERVAWNFFVRHYTDETRQQRDPKYRPEHEGVLYPRCATLGGCTAHNAMILMDNQTSQDGARNGLFTGTLKKVWNGGKFPGNYRKFRDVIVSAMPSEQTPNYYFVGAANPKFEAQRPFAV